MGSINTAHNTGGDDNLQHPGAVDAGAVDALRETKKIQLADLDWSAATTVKGIGYRFLLPVPNLGAENEEISVKDWKGEEKKVIGMPFYNATDSAKQAVVGDGTGVIIFAVDPAKVDRVQFSQAMFAAVEKLGGIENLTRESITTLLGLVPTLIRETAFDPSSLPKADAYDSTDSIASGMTPQSGSYIAGSRPFGLFEKADKPGPLALFVEGDCEVYGGPHASAAKFKNGFMAVQIPPKKEGDAPSYRTVAPEAISYCYVLADGRPIKTADLGQG